MKLLTTVLILLLSATSFAANKITFGEDGFVECLTKNGETYYFLWDTVTRAESRQMFVIAESELRTQHGISVSSCRDRKYIENWTELNVKPVDDLNKFFPKIIIESARQLKIGGRFFRKEQSARDYYLKNKSLFVSDRPEVLTQLKTRYGTTFAEEVMKIWSTDLIKHYGGDESCKSLIGTCDFYICQEQKNACGASGYNLGFGYKYCSDSKFKLLKQMTTSLGKQWVKDVFTCLQKGNLEHSDLLEKSIESKKSGVIDEDQRDKSKTCNSIQRDSFDRHAECYAQAGFCDLEFSEKTKIFLTIKDEILSFQTIVQGNDLLQRCSPKFSPRDRVTSGSHGE